MNALRARSCALRAGRWALYAALAASAGLARADLPVEELKGGTRLPPATPHRLYVMDAVFNHLVDSRVNIYDGDTMKFLGLVPTSFNGHMTVSADGKDIYVMTTYYERLNRGKRTDVVEAWDAETLTPKFEVPIPQKRAQALNYRNYLRQSTDGGLLLVQNATPASSVTVVDLKTRQFADEVTAAAGCWSIIVLPSRPRSFASICGDGALLTVDLDQAGKPMGQQRSQPMFEPEKDPIFTHTENLGNTFYFVSYNGNVYSADFSGKDAVFGKPWSLLEASGKDQGWRPGGYNLLAVNQASKRLYVGMHPNGAEGSHKTPAAEIWVYDLATRKRVARVPGKNALSMSVSQDDQPRLYTLDGGNVNIYDAAPAAPVFKGTIQAAGETALQVEPQPRGTP
ncbi:amine dehydrogenase large subunit [Achromobacter insolitus]|uniref:amine dehydrogenase large subunit n=1 Tax=Achromobacter insolitus TaxID=217204 RepID=UPI0005387F03|nr:amine dehydrogenase large subunit [Achromobacter insolitus]APX73615.1 amine dehydrogenase [Achromobacter insolitus]AVG38399.1 amine dehydrogenase [Achromobacter insolitus]MDH3065644.1 amine dehydrogenase large subunit [Achromobacter insolitus]MDQ6214085.1 amine dehydrogenase [Achromobacter insolitus]NGT18532.1 amine dehydrogenase [Achromobacter insolitus]